MHHVSLSYFDYSIHAVNFGLVFVDYFTVFGLTAHRVHMSSTGY